MIESERGEMFWTVEGGGRAMVVFGRWPKEITFQKVNLDQPKLIKCHRQRMLKLTRVKNLLEPFGKTSLLYMSNIATSITKQNRFQRRSNGARMYVCPSWLSSSHTHGHVIVQYNNLFHRVSLGNFSFSYTWFTHFLNKK